MRNYVILPASCFGNRENYLFLLMTFYLLRCWQIERVVYDMERIDGGNCLFSPLLQEGRTNRYDLWVLNASFIVYPNIMIDGSCSASDKLSVIGGNHDLARFGDFRIRRGGSRALIELFCWGALKRFEVIIEGRASNSEILSIEDEFDAFVDIPRLRSPKIVEFLYTNRSSVVVERYRIGGI